MNLKSKKSPLTISLLIAFVIHIIIILLLSVIYFEKISDEDSYGVILELIEYERKVVQLKKIEKIPKKFIPRPLPKQIRENIISETLEFTEAEILPGKIDSSTISEIDSLEYYSNLLDSLVVNFPSLLVLKSAMTEHIKNDPKIETDSAMVVRRMRKYMLDYYKHKFPTPLSKFGEGNPGIPIDKILDLFSSDEDIDEKKIKKYLNINTP